MKWGIAVISLAFVCLVGLNLVTETEAGWGDCWDTWSRCSRWSSGGTGILWQSCAKRCQCLGKATGSCVISRSACPLSNKAWQCKCSSARRSGRKPSWCGF
ncbi:hypothetical protein TCAL_03912 [Tigriopus californicus]|uniref:Theromacin-like protein n=1 Tax=Tigriopus californicus TaxID=6832 RepID=A0A553NCM8_TIGCA|nr:hypothetical protein TCAL_03912 [Tigriopus californicus]|eukprot:TCALIF_03912-PA protein Name:"Similar to Hydramacin-1 (Hydra vulgaris)" AED:0.00 eAED:0.00 QI:126/1/1/1/0/0.5/2/29/100